MPRVSLSAETSVSRAGRSILHAANHSELASDLPWLRALRLDMRNRLLASPLMDHRRFARDFVAAYRQIWRAWCERHKP